MRRGPRPDAPLHSVKSNDVDRAGNLKLKQANALLLPVAVWKLPNSDSQIRNREQAIVNESKVFWEFR